MHSARGAASRPVETPWRGSRPGCCGRLRRAGRQSADPLAQAFGARRAEAREVDEALPAGSAARTALRSAADLLSSARSWSAYDTFAGGGLISSVIKHDRLDQAGATMRQADAQLARFTRELADVDRNGVGPVGVSGPLAPTRAHQATVDGRPHPTHRATRGPPAATRLAKPVRRRDGQVSRRDGQVSRRGGQG